MTSGNESSGQDALHLVNRLGESRSPYVSPSIHCLGAGQLVDLMLTVDLARFEDIETIL